VLTVVRLVNLLAVVGLQPDDIPLLGLDSDFSGTPPPAYTVGGPLSFCGRDVPVCGCDVPGCGSDVPG
jgi:hypothetical protein